MSHNRNDMEHNCYCIFFLFLVAKWCIYIVEVVRANGIISCPLVRQRWQQTTTLWPSLSLSLKLFLVRNIINISYIANMLKGYGRTKLEASVWRIYATRNSQEHKERRITFNMNADTNVPWSRIIESI